MKQELNRHRLFWVLMLVCAVSFLGHLAVLPAMPDTVPCHWNAAGAVDGWAPKQMLPLLGLLPAGLLVLLRILPHIDPKKESYRRSRKAWEVFQVFFIIFTICASWLGELSVWGLLDERRTNILVFSGLGSLFLAIGNYMPQIRQNYTFGIKTPWALDNEHNWQRTQRMGGITFTLLGLATLLGIFAPTTFSGFVFPALILAACLWCYLYSYLVFIGKLK